MNLEEFIKECEQSSILKRFDIPITKEVLREAGIKPDMMGEYKRSQLIDLSYKINVEKLLTRIKTLPEIKNPLIEIDTIFKDSASFNKEIQSILFLLLRPEFQEEIKNFRKKWYIPPEGFDDLNGMTEFISKFFAKVTKIIRRNKENQAILLKELKETTARIQKMEKTQTVAGREKKVQPKLLTMKNLEIAFANGLIFSDISEIMCKFRTERYSRACEEILRYCFFLRNPLSLDNLKDSIGISTIKGAAFYNQNIIGISRSKDMFELHLLIHGGTTKDDVIKVVNKNWRQVKEWQKQVSPSEKPIKIVKKIKDMYRDYLVFHYYQNKFTNKQIAGILSTNYNYNRINSNLVRKIVERVKKRINNT